jgi:hypothetical protein
MSNEQSLTGREVTKTWPRTVLVRVTRAASYNGGNHIRISAEVDQGWAPTRARHVFLAVGGLRAIEEYVSDPNGCSFVLPDADDLSAEVILGARWGVLVPSD